MLCTVQYKQAKDDLIQEPYIHEPDEDEIDPGPPDDRWR